jgi:hypothetical protein
MAIPDKCVLVGIHCSEADAVAELVQAISDYYLPCGYESRYFTFRTPLKHLCAEAFGLDCSNFFPNRWHERLHLTPEKLDAGLNSLTVENFEHVGFEVPISMVNLIAISIQKFYEGVCRTVRSFEAFCNAITAKELFTVFGQIINALDNNFFINSILRRIALCTYTEKTIIIIGDVQYKTELEWLRKVPCAITVKYMGWEPQQKRRRIATRTYDAHTGDNIRKAGVYIEDDDGFDIEEAHMSRIKDLFKDVNVFFKLWKF